MVIHRQRQPRESVPIYVRVRKETAEHIEAELARKPDQTITALVSRLIEAGIAAERER